MATIQVKSVTSPQLTAQKITPVYYWATFGVAMVLLQTYVYASWIMSPDFRPVPTGIDPVPDNIKFWAFVLQAAITTLGIAMVIWVVRQCYQQKRFTFDAMLLIGWTSCFWLDPVPNYIRPQVFFNSYYVNFGSWVEHIPGWVAPTGALLPNAMFAEGMAFVANIFGSLVACIVMRWAQQTWKLSNFRTYLVGVAMSMMVFLIMEECMIRAGWLAWPGVIQALSLHAGTVYQMPLTEVLLCGIFLGGFMAALRYFKDDRGLSIVERGIERVEFGGAAFKRALSLFAVIGFCNLGWILYNLTTIPLALFSDDMPAGFPSYMTNNMCGSKEINLCPSKSAPIYNIHSPGVASLPGVKGNR